MSEREDEFAFVLTFVLYLSPGNDTFSNKFSLFALHETNLTFYYLKKKNNNNNHEAYLLPTEYFIQ